MTNSTASAKALRATNPITVRGDQSGRTYGAVRTPTLQATELPQSVIEAAHEAATKTFEALDGVVSADLLIEGHHLRAFPDGRVYETVEGPGVFTERALLVASVPKSASFEFGYDGFSFFTVRGQFVAVVR